MGLTLFRSFTIASVASNMSSDMNLFTVLDSVIFLNAIILASSESFAISFHYSSLPEVLKWFITLWWPTDSTTVWMPLLLQSIGYTNQFCVNPEGTCQLVAASTERSNVDFFSTINFLHMCSNKIVVARVTTMATMTCFMAYMLFPILEPWRLTCWWP